MKYSFPDDPLNLIPTGSWTKKIPQNSRFVQSLCNLDNCVPTKMPQSPSKFEIGCFTVAYMTHFSKTCLSHVRVFE